MTTNTDTQAHGGGVEADAIQFITDLVHMQSGQGWTRAVVREAAAAFLNNHGIPITGHGDTTASIAALAASPAAPAPAAGVIDAVLSHAQMLLLAVEAGDPKPELVMRVKDLIAAATPDAKGER